METKIERTPFTFLERAAGSSFAALAAGFPRKAVITCPGFARCTVAPCPPKLGEGAVLRSYWYGNACADDANPAIKARLAVMAMRSFLWWESTLSPLTSR